MNILYVSCANERAKEFQLQTIIYEEENKKYVVKKALNNDSIKHLKKMRDNYEKLSSLIINSRIKLAKIVKEDEDSLTFEYIDGMSLEKKFFNAINESKDEAKLVLDEYLSLIKTGFESINYSSESINSEFKKFLKNDDILLDIQKDCFAKYSNVDLILSNIIEKDNMYYIIDYEWVYNISIPIDYVFYRTMDSLSYKFGIKYKDIILSLKKNYFGKELSKNYMRVENKFQKIVSDNWKNNLNKFHRKVESPDYLYELISDKNNQLIDKNEQIKNKNEQIKNKIEEIKNRDSQIYDLVHLADSLRLKNRIKGLIKRLIGNKTYELLKYLKNNYSSVSKKTIVTLKNEGLKSLILKIRKNLKSTSYKYIEPKITNNIKDEIINFQEKPLISIIMPVYNVDPKWLELAINSIQEQWYTNWELCICDDKSTSSKTIEYLKSIKDSKIKIKFSEQNMNISGASNQAFSLCSGEYIALMDNDDEITPDALYEIVKAINIKNADFVYSDEDFITVDAECINPHFKPDFSPDLLKSHNYITHLSCMKRELFNEVGGFRSKFDGAQDYDLFLRVTEKAKKIIHIPKVLYHWRMIETSTSMNSDVKPEAMNCGKMALEETAIRRGFRADVLDGNLNHYFRVKYEIVNNPLVSIVIPFKDKPELLKMCIESILQKSSYSNYEIIGISNNSSEKETFDEMKRLKEIDQRVNFHEYNEPFNYSRINNYAVKNFVKGTHVLLLNNDIEIISNDWLESMLEHSQREEIGCVGAKLYYPDGKIQHAGIIIGLGGYAAHSHRLSNRDDYGYFNRLNIIQNLSAVTAACLMVKKSIYEELNGLNETDFTVAYNDVDFCLRVQEKGYLNLFTPYAQAYHYESISRGYEETPEKIERFDKEKEALYNRHKDLLDNGDPFYNKNLTLNREDFSLK